jgi:hypothetical protein
VDSFVDILILIQKRFVVDMVLGLKLVEKSLKSSQVELGSFPKIEDKQNELQYFPDFPSRKVQLLNPKQQSLHNLQTDCAILIDKQLNRNFTLYHFQCQDFGCVACFFMDFLQITLAINSRY